MEEEELCHYYSISIIFTPADNTWRIWSFGSVFSWRRVAAENLRITSIKKKIAGILISIFIATLSGMVDLNVLEILIDMLKGLFAAIETINLVR